MIGPARLVMENNVHNKQKRKEKIRVENERDVSTFSINIKRKIKNTMNFMSTNLTTQMKWTKSVKDITTKIHSKRNNLNSSMSTKGIEFVAKNFPTKTSGSNGFTGEFYYIFKEEIN